MKVHSQSALTYLSDQAELSFLCPKWFRHLWGRHGPAFVVRQQRRSETAKVESLRKGGQLLRDRRRFLHGRGFVGVRTEALRVRHHVLTLLLVSVRGLITLVTFSRTGVGGTWAPVITRYKHRITWGGSSNDVHGWCGHRGSTGCDVTLNAPVLLSSNPRLLPS